MMNKALAIRYAQDIHHNLRLYAAWPPNEPIALGDYGALSNAIFERKGSLSECGVNVATLTNATKSHWDYQSEGVTFESVDLEADANAPAPGAPVGAKGRLTVSFRNAYSVLFATADCVLQTIDHLKELQGAILALYKNGTLSADYVVVTNAVRAGATTMIISENGGGSISLDANVAASEINLLSAQVGLVVKRAENIGFHAIAEPGLVPLFGVSGLQRKNFLENLFDPESHFVTVGATPGRADESVSGADMVQRYHTLTPQEAVDVGAFDDVFAFRKLP
jgi:hypothetical protein